MTTFPEFDITHDDFHIGGLFNICERLLIEVSTNIHHEFEIESVRLLVAEDHAVSVPSFISDFVAAWALTTDGKAVIQRKRDERVWLSCPASEIAAIHADDLRDQRAA